MSKGTLILSTALAFSLTGCIQSAKEIGQNPRLSAVGEGLPVQDLNDTDQQYSSLANANSFSTWNSQSGSLFTDNRAIKRGDILTVLVLRQTGYYRRTRRSTNGRPYSLFTLWLRSNN
mgnify:CR=1 FL=1